jgi:hypothetical protein
MIWPVTRTLTPVKAVSRRVSRSPLTAPRRSARLTPAWSRRAACERRPLRRVGCGRRV